MVQDTRSVSEEFDRRERREREPHKPTVHVRVDGLIDEAMVRQIVREEIERLVGIVVKGLSADE